MNPRRDAALAPAIRPRVARLAAGVLRAPLGIVLGASPAGAQTTERVDPGAARGVSFTQRLQLVLGR